jgi:hypothetical protein
VVFQFLNYQQPSLNPVRTPPGFSRWFFSFIATNNQPRILSGHHQASAGGTSTSQYSLPKNFATCAEVNSQAMKLKDHRLKPGGVLKDSGAVVGSYEIESPPAKAMWCRSALSD